MFCVLLCLFSFCFFLNSQTMRRDLNMAQLSQQLPDKPWTKRSEWRLSSLVEPPCLTLTETESFQNVLFSKKAAVWSASINISKLLHWWCNAYGYCCVEQCWSPSTCKFIWPLKAIVIMLIISYDNCLLQSIHLEKYLYLWFFFFFFGNSSCCPTTPCLKHSLCRRWLLVKQNA